MQKDVIARCAKKRKKTKQWRAPLTITRHVLLTVLYPKQNNANSALLMRSHVMRPRPGITRTLTLIRSQHPLDCRELQHRRRVKGDRWISG